jgi:hypothetical protein
MTTTVFTTPLKSCDWVQTPDGIGQLTLMHKFKGTVRFFPSQNKKAYLWDEMTKVAAAPSPA